MKKIITCIFFFAFVIQIDAQVNYSGMYGYTEKPPGDPPKENKDEGPTGTLILLKMDNNTYRFWLDVNKGWPSYTTGESDGTITFKNDKARFDNTYEGAMDSCLLVFQSGSNLITITSSSHGASCGFGFSVYADGEYKKLKQQPILNNTWLNQQYSQSPHVIVIADKAQVYEDEVFHYPKNQYFVKGDHLISIADSEKAIYTEFITPGGKFVYGWIKKTAIKNSGNEE
jgi:hypothetical protein